MELDLANKIARALTLSEGVNVKTVGVLMELIRHVPPSEDKKVLYERIEMLLDRMNEQSEANSDLTKALWGEAGDAN